MLLRCELPNKSSKYILPAILLFTVQFGILRGADAKVRLLNIEKYVYV